MAYFTMKDAKYSWIYFVRPTVLILTRSQLPAATAAENTAKPKMQTEGRSYNLLGPTPSNRQISKVTELLDTNEYKMRSNVFALC